MTNYRLTPYVNGEQKALYLVPDMTISDAERNELLTQAMQSDTEQTFGDSIGWLMVAGIIFVVLAICVLGPTIDGL